MLLKPMKTRTKRIEVFLTTVLIFASLNARASQSGEDRLRLIHADEFKQETKDEKTEQRLQGNVTFEQGKYLSVLKHAKSDDSSDIYRLLSALSRKVHG